MIRQSAPKAFLFALSITALLIVPSHAQWIGSRKPNAVVADDGSERFRTVQEAIDAVPSTEHPRFFIQIKPGAYKEKILIPKTKGPLTLYGENAETTILTYDDYAGKLDATGAKLGSGNSYSTKIEADDFAAENLTFRNEHVKGAAEGDQALAVSLSGDRLIFKKCRFIGWQDTIYADRNREYFDECYIAGQVDYIFGGATSFFDRCELHCVGPGISITAASTPQDQIFGYVFSHCKITAAEPANWKTHLGRPWRPYACVTYLYTEMPGIIAPRAWDNWKKSENEQTARFCEYKSAGPGANPGARVPWSRQINDEEAAGYTIQNVLRGSDGWNPAPGARPATSQPKNR